MTGTAGFRLLDQIKSLVRGRQRQHFCFRDADQHDRFRVFDELGAFEHSVRADCHQNVNGLARVPRRADEIGGDEGPGNRLARLEDRRYCDVGADGPVAIRALDQRSCRNLANVARQELGLREHWRPRKQDDGHDHCE